MVLDLLVSKAGIAIAGAAGGIVRWITLRETVGNGALSIIAGAIIAAFASPAVEPIFAPFLSGLDMDDASRAGLVGFMCGVGGIGIAGWILDLVKAKRKGGGE